jgi:hypothetical protein
VDIVYPAFGSIEVEGTTFDHDVVIESGEVRARDKGPSRGRAPGHTPLTVAEAIPWSGRRLVIGSGHSGSLPVTDDVYDQAAERAVELVVLPTSEACALLRDADPSEVNAILHVTC